MGFIDDLGLSMGQSAVSGIFGLALQDMNDRRQLRQQEALMKQQIAGQKELTDYNFGKGLQMWERTNYKAQQEQMKKAGLNPALMYGMGGGGGTTAGVSPGSVTGGSAPAGGREVMDSLGMGLQLGLMKAQKEVLESQAEKNRADADKTKGVDTEEAQTRIKSLMQGIDNAQAQKQILLVENRLKELQEFEQRASQEDRLDYIHYQTKQAMRHLEMAENEVFISNATINDKIKIIRQEAIGAVLRNALTKAQTAKTKSDITINNAQIQKWSQEIAQGWEELGQSGQRVTIEEFRANIAKFEAEIKANFPGISQAIGKIINDGMESIFNATKGGRQQHYGPRERETFNK